MTKIRPFDAANYRAFWVSLALGLGVFALYGRALRYEFVTYDTYDSVIGNPMVNTGPSWDGLRWAFTTNMGGYKMPLTFLSHMLDCQLFGLNSAGHLAVNLLFHIVNTLLLFLALRRLTGVFWRSAFVAAVFAFHPTHVESVAWVAERKDLLSALFWILTLLAYNSYARGAFSVWRGFLVMFAMTLGLLSKPSLITLPFLLLLLDFWPLRRWPLTQDPDCSAPPARKTPLPWLMIEKIPLFLLALAFTALTYHGQKKIGAIIALPLQVRLGNIPINYLAYLRETVYPFSLSIYYPVARTLQPWPRIAGALLLLLAVSFAALLNWRRRPWLLVGWFWFIGLLFPTIGIVQINSAICDRYTYLSQTGLVICFAWAGAELFGRLRRRREAGLLATLLLALLMLRSAHQLTFWHDDMALWTHAMQVTAPNAEPYTALAHRFEAWGNFGQAERYFRICIDLEPDEVKHYYSLGRIKSEQGDTTAALALFKKAIELKPEDYLGFVNLGEFYFADGRPAEAREQYEKAQKLIDDNPRLDIDLGMIYFMNGNWAAATAAFNQALKTEPRSSVALFNLGRIAREVQHDNEKALKYFEASTLGSPGNPEIFRSIGEVWAEKGDKSRAGDYFRFALSLARQSGDTDALNKIEKDLIELK